jgi:predicted acetyltransferase
VRLTRPSVDLRDGVLEGLREFQREGLSSYAAIDVDAIAADFARYVRDESAKADRPAAGNVPQTELWATVERTYVGRIAIRHRLSDALERIGGHIGYDVRPPFRGRGYATEMLRESLPIARTLGLGRVLLTCDDRNIASARAIEKNGGVLERCALPYPDQPLKRYYWIAL